VIGKVNAIAMRERFQALLNKWHFLDSTHTQVQLQILCDVIQSKPFFAAAFWVGARHGAVPRFPAA
jgi:hypothetical protein